MNDTERKQYHWLLPDHVAFLLLPIPTVMILMGQSVPFWVACWATLWGLALTYDLFEKADSDIGGRR